MDEHVVWLMISSIALREVVVHLLLAEIHATLRD
jgi:hypothetical protein